MIGLWKGITRYYKREPEDFNRKEFVDMICAYICYEMADVFNSLSIIRISDKQWRNFAETRKIARANPNASEEQLRSLVASAGLRYGWYIKIKMTMNHASLDATIGGEDDTDKHNFRSYYEVGTKVFINKNWLYN